MLYETISWIPLNFASRLTLRWVYMYNLDYRQALNSQAVAEMYISINTNPTLEKGQSKAFPQS